MPRSVLRAGGDRVVACRAERLEVVGVVASWSERPELVEVVDVLRDPWRIAQLAERVPLEVAPACGLPLRVVAAFVP
jgi:hypothetical protein